MNEKHFNQKKIKNPIIMRLIGNNNIDLPK